MCPEMRAHRRGSQGGAGLPLALFVLVVLSLVAVALSELSREAGNRHGLEVNAVRAFYAAESGAQMAVHRVYPPAGSGSACSAGVVGQTFAVEGLVGCRVSVDCVSQVIGASTFREFTSTGVCGSFQDEARRIVQVRVK